MNKQNLHIVLVAIISALILGVVTFATPLLPILFHGDFPSWVQIKPNIAIALGEIIKAVLAVGVVYTTKIKYLGSSQASGSDVK